MGNQFSDSLGKHKVLQSYNFPPLIWFDSVIRDLYTFLFIKWKSTLQGHRATVIDHLCWC